VFDFRYVESSTHKHVPRWHDALCDPEWCNNWLSTLFMSMGWHDVSELRSPTVEWYWQEIRGEKTCPSSTLSTTNPTWSDPGANPGLRGERPATNRLNHGTVFMIASKNAVNFSVTCLPKLMFSSVFLCCNESFRRHEVTSIGRCGRHTVGGNRTRPFSTLMMEEGVTCCHMSVSICQTSGPTSRRSPSSSYPQISHTITRICQSWNILESCVSTVDLLAFIFFHNLFS
jgi:hypothetical protein